MVKYFFDAYISGVGVLREPVILYVEEGKIINIKGGRQAEEFKQLRMETS
jgi:leucyl aminopeptidase (aminopeptidase T)